MPYQKLVIRLLHQINNGRGLNEIPPRGVKEMKTLQDNYTKALSQAKELPSHINGELQGHYKFYVSDINQSFILLSGDQVTPVSVFEAMNQRYRGATRFYIKSMPTYREDGNLLPMKFWAKKLMFHKAWSRNDIEVIDVKFNIVGIKRQTSHLPAAVLIRDIEFITNL